MSPVSLYVNFVLRAIYGQLAQADWLMREHGQAIRMVARALQARHPFEAKPLHRGILLDGEFDPSGREFVSWSEDLEVAQWFADPGSVMNEFASAAKPASAGRLLTMAQPTRVLFHHSWSKLQDFPSLALQHPEMGLEGARQIEWSLSTQTEVITDPPMEWPEPLSFSVTRHTTRELDQKLAPPWLSRVS